MARVKHTNAIYNSYYRNMKLHVITPLCYVVTRSREPPGRFDLQEGFSGRLDVELELATLIS